MKKAVIFFISLALAGAAAACESGHWINKVASGGEFVILEDNSVWRISAMDTVDTALWLPTTNIVACSDKLVNTDDGETADAQRIR